MTATNHISAHPRLFAGLCVSPICLLVVVQACFIISGILVPPNYLPPGVWYATDLYFFALVAVIGFVVSYCLSLLIAWRYWPLSKSWTDACMVVFIVTWTIVFGSLSWLGFSMGMGASPQLTLQEVMISLFTIPLLALSQMTLISLLICTSITIILVALAGGIAWCLSIINSTNT